RVAAPPTGERPAALPAVLCSDEPSGHPLAFERRCRRLPCSRVFLPGTRRASPVPMQPFAACCRHYPAGIGCGYQPASSAADAAFASTREAQLPDIVLTGLA